MTTLDYLKIGYNFLKNHPERWCKNRFTGPNGQRCMLSACTNGDMCGPPSVARVLADTVKDISRESEYAFGTVSSFNDHEHTTHAHVILVFEEAIRREEAKGTPNA